jgi:hypothetical protein
MWPSDNKMQAFRALSYRDMWRVRMCLRRGEAPDEPRLAAAAVDLAEGYRRQGRVEAALISWYPLVAIVWFGYLSISAAARGDEWVLILFVLGVPLGIAGFLLDPGRRPQNVARSLEASRRILPSSWSLGSTAQPADNGPDIAAGWYADPDNYTVERLWDGEDWTSWVRPRPIREGGFETDPAGWQPHPSKPGKEMLWSGNGWTDRVRDTVDQNA